MKDIKLQFFRIIAPLIFLLIGGLVLVIKSNPEEPQAPIFMAASIIIVVLSIVWIIFQLGILSGKYARILAIVSAPIALVLSYYVYASIADELKFKATLDQRIEVIKERLLKIREAQFAYKQAKGAYCSNFDDLINFLKNDSVPEVIKFGNADDSIAVAKGLVKIDTVWHKVIGKAYIQTFPVDSLRFVPFAVNEQFLLEAGELYQGEVGVPVFMSSTNYKYFLNDLFKEYNRIPVDSVIQIGSMTEATTNGNWN